MTSGLRKKHKFNWVVLAIVLPLVGLMATKMPLQSESSTNIEGTQKLDMVASSEDLSVFIKKLDSSSFLVLDLKKTVASPFPVLYALPEADSNLEAGTLLGRVNGGGITQYTISGLGTIKQLLIYDEVHGEIEQSLIID